MKDSVCFMNHMIMRKFVIVSDTFFTFVHANYKDSFTAHVQTMMETNLIQFFFVNQSDASR